MNAKITALAENNGNLISTAQIVEVGFSKTAITKYVANNELIRVSHGIYCLPDKVIDDMYLLYLKCNLIIFSHETALFLNGLSERTPFLLSLTIPSDRMLPHSIRSECICFYIRPELFELGLEERKTTFGNMVRCYNAERTLCDILRSRSRIDEETVITAIKKYAELQDKDLFRLYEYAREFKVLSLVKKYLEVLI